MNSATGSISDSGRSSTSRISFSRVVMPCRIARVRIQKRVRLRGVASQPVALREIPMRLTYMKNALKACRRDKSKAKRAKCMKQANARYGGKKKKRKT